MAVGTADVNFGASGSHDASVAVAAAAVGAGTKVEAYVIVPPNDTGRPADEYWVEDLRVYAGNIVAGVGFTIFAKCALGRAYGSFTINYVTL